MNKKWLFKDDGWSTGKGNMAADEAMLNNKIIYPEMPPILRVYCWVPPCISLGRTQPLIGINLEKCDELKVDVVRRLSGGTAILHHRELTYSVVISQSDGIPFSIAESFQVINQGLIAAYAKLGVVVEFIAHQEKNYSFWCFASQGVADLAYQGKKIIGSAQYRGENTLLQHGSLVIKHDAKLMSELMPETSLPEMIDLETIRGGTTAREIKEALRQGFEEALGIEFTDV